MLKVLGFRKATKAKGAANGMIHNNYIYILYIYIYILNCTLSASSDFFLQDLLIHLCLHINLSDSASDLPQDFRQILHSKQFLHVLVSCHAAMPSLLDFSRVRHICSVDALSKCRRLHFLRSWLLVSPRSVQYWNYFGAPDNDATNGCVQTGYTQIQSCIITFSRSP